MVKNPPERTQRVVPYIGYEDALPDLAHAVYVGCELTGGHPWIEIDFPENLAQARALA